MLIQKMNRQYMCPLRNQTVEHNQKKHNNLSISGSTKTIFHLCSGRSEMVGIERFEPRTNGDVSRKPNLKLAIRKLIYEYQLVKSHLNLML